MKRQLSDPSNVRNSVLFLKNRVRQGLGNNLLINPDFYLKERPNNSGVFDGSGPYNDDGDQINDGWQVLSDGNDIADFSYNSTFQGLLCDVQTAKRFGVIQKCLSFESLRYADGKASFYFMAQADINTQIRVAVLSWNSTADTITNDIVSSWASTPTWVTNVTAENDDTVDYDIGSIAKPIIIDNIDIDTSGMNNLMVMIWTPNEEPIGQKIYIKNCNLNKGKFSHNYETRKLADEILLARLFYEEMYVIQKAYGSSNGTNYLLAKDFNFMPKRTSTPTLTAKFTWTVQEDGSGTNQQASYTKQLINVNRVSAIAQVFKAIAASRPANMSNTIIIDDAI